MQFRVEGSLGANSALVLSNASTLSLGANAQKFGSVTVASGTISGPTTITASSFHLYQGVVEPMLAGGTLSTFGPSTDSISIYGANTYTEVVLPDTKHANCDGTVVNRAS